MTAQQVIERVLIGHAADHANSLRQGLGQTAAIPTTGKRLPPDAARAAVGPSAAGGSGTSLPHAMMATFGEQHLPGSSRVGQSGELNGVKGDACRGSHDRQHQSEAGALALDAADPLAHFRERFHLLPGRIYLDGNSLGLLSRDAEAETLQR